MPPITRSELDAEGQKAFDARATPPTPGPGPGHVTIYSPRVAEGLGLMGRALGVPRGDGFPLGARMFQLVVLITAREIDQQYEWCAHEPAGLRDGLEQSVIDVVKYDRDVTGLADKDATVIRFLRALLREHKVSSELWAKMASDVRPPADDRDHRAHGRLLHRGDDDERRRSAPAARPQGAAAAAGEIGSRWWPAPG